MQLQALLLAYTNLVRRFLQLSYMKGNTCKSIEARVYPKKSKETACRKLYNYLTEKIELIKPGNRV